MHEPDEIVQARRVGRLAVARIVADEANLRVHKRHEQRIETLKPEDMHGEQQNDAEREQCVYDDEPEQRPNGAPVE